MTRTRGSTRDGTAATVSRVARKTSAPERRRAEAGTLHQAAQSLASPLARARTRWALAAADDWLRHAFTRRLSAGAAGALAARSGLVETQVGLVEEPACGRTDQVPGAAV